MTRIFTFLLFVLPSMIFAQKKYTKCSYTYFKGGKVSTSQCFDAENRWGQARAFNTAGEIIYEKELRRIAGHSSVTFSFFENGGVKKAEWSSAPDGGIQWYRSYTWFGENGKVEREEQDNWDNNPITTVPGHPKTPYTAPPKHPAPQKTETAECAEIWVSEFWVTNSAPYSVIITATRKGGIPDTHTATLRPRQSLKLGQMPGAQIFEDPSRYFTIEAQPLKPVSKRRLIVLPSEKRPDSVSRITRRYYFTVRRIL